MKPAPQRSRWSFSIGRIAGIEIRVHGTFLALLGWILLSHLAAGERVAAATRGVLFVVAVFGIVVLHELGHALTARQFGIRTQDITLLPIGGVARLEKMPEKPSQELLVAVAGPAVNVALAALAYAGLRLTGGPLALGAIQVASGSLLARLLWVNVALAVFNLLPAFPLDGGRVLRALLAMKMDRVRATDVAARIGQAMALLFGMAGLFGSPMLVFVAFFVWIGAAEEDAIVHMTAALERVRVADAMVTRFELLEANLSIAEGVERALRALQRDFPVRQGERLVGFVSAAELVRAMSEGAGDRPISEIATPVDVVVEPSEAVATAMEKLARSGGGVLPVLQAGELVGLLVPENVAEIAAINDRVRVRHA